MVIPMASSQGDARGIPQPMDSGGGAGARPIDGWLSTGRASVDRVRQAQVMHKTRPGRESRKNAANAPTPIGGYS
jgi:hypothetical protein